MDLGPVRVLLLSADFRTARLIDDVLHATWSRTQLLTHAGMDAAAAQALVDHPSCCVLLDVPAGVREEALELLAYVRLSAPEASIVLLCDGDDEALALEALKAGAQDCLAKSELAPALLRRSLTHAIERKRSEARVAHQALHDQLTGLPNRALFLDRLGVALERARRSGTQVAVMFLDFDNFKRINDTRGHAVGDRVLAALAQRLSTLLRPMDTVARFGGDEFTFLFEDLTSEREVVLIADRICHAASPPVEIDGVELIVTVSIGIAIVGDPAVSPETVIREADAAMYRAKERGRSRYELFDEESRQRAVARIELENAIRHAVERGQLRLQYQPRVALNAFTDMVWVEAQVHWQHPRRGLLGPGEFMPLAEETGVAPVIGRFALEQALAQFAPWRASRPDMRLSLSLSSRQLRDANLASVLSDAIAAAGIDPRAICLEVPEGAVGEDPETVTATLRRLAATGVRLALRDFGSGAASFSRLRELPVDAIKIHEDFVKALGESDEDASIVGALIELGHALGLTVIAGGTQTAAQLELLRALGCDAAQGDLIGPPVTAEQAEALLVAEVA
ncbi:MAG TPA: EAL domain-containing protein [Solirubrobacteraceae bacterium]|nr:EAL domain-containing protein [Solirubrobacteraceae bacterium]